MVDLRAALGQLDTLNDAHWTADGAPRMDVLVELTGDASLTRKQLTDAFPLFNREKTDLPGGDKTAEEIAAEELATKNAQEAAEALAAAGGTNAQGQAASQPAASPASGAGTETGAATAANGADANGQVTTGPDAPASDEAAAKDPAQQDDSTEQIKQPVQTGEDHGTDAEGLLTDGPGEIQEAYDDDNPEHLRRKLAGFAEAEADAKDDLEIAKKRLAAVQKEGDRIKDKLNVLEPNPSNQDAIGEYLRSQHRLRAEKHSTRKEILGGLTLKDLQAKAPIDEAMSRKNTRGTLRPTRTI